MQTKCPAQMLEPNAGYAFGLAINRKPNADKLGSDSKVQKAGLERLMASRMIMVKEKRVNLVSRRNGPDRLHSPSALAEKADQSPICTKFHPCKTQSYNPGSELLAGYGLALQWIHPLWS